MAFRDCYSCSRYYFAIYSTEKSQGVYRWSRKTWTNVFEVDDKPVVAITVVNKSLHSIRIKAIFWVVGGENEIQQMFRNQAYDPLPIRLEHGDEANYRIIISDDDSWLKRIAKRLLDENASVEKCSVL